jgi:3'-phosphoadenosine 5'-phosphosulfate sulfotransferase (PAPS reductase)/FAD synthetase
MLTPTKPRVISWFSCGAASAVATILAAVKYGEIEAVYCRVVEEHEDNLRFLDDFTRVTGIPVKVIVDEQHEGSIYKVFAKRGFIKNQYGAPCTMILKKDMRKSYQRPGDIQVFGYTVEEQDRADRFIDGNNDVTEDFILIDNKVSKQDCYKHLTRLGLKLPAMYHLGYSNNNCIGCVKGGDGLLEQDSQGLSRPVRQDGKSRKTYWSRCKQGRKRPGVLGRVGTQSWTVQSGHASRLRFYVRGGLC